MSLVLFVSYTHSRGKAGSARAIGVSAIISTDDRATLRFPKGIGTTRSVDLTFHIDKAVHGVCIRSNTHIERKRLLTRLSPTSCQIRLSTARTRCGRVGTRTRHIVTLCGRGKAAPGTGSGTICNLGRVATGCRRRGSRLRCAQLCTPFYNFVRGGLFSTRRAVKTNVPIVSVIDTNVPRIRVGLPTTSCVQQSQFSNCRYAFSLCPKRGCPLGLVDIAPGTGTGRLCAVHLRVIPNGLPLPSPKVGAVIAVCYGRNSSRPISIPNKTLLRGSNGACIFICSPSTKGIRDYRIAILHLLSSKHTVIISSALRTNRVIITSNIRRVRSKRGIQPLTANSGAGMKKLL